VTIMPTLNISNMTNITDDYYNTTDDYYNTTDDYYYNVTDDYSNSTNTTNDDYTNSTNSSMPSLMPSLMPTMNSAAPSFRPTSGGGGGGGGGDSCFSGSETVLLQSGDTVPISAVRIGDIILASDSQGRTQHSKVIAVPHEFNQIRSTFTHVQVSSGKDLKLTAEHLMLISSNCVGDFKLMKASDVTPGMCAQTMSGSDRVTSVSHNVAGEGLYTVVVEADYVVVNGFVASPFAVNHAVARAYYQVAQMLPAFVRQTKLFKQAGEIIGSMAASVRLL